MWGKIADELEGIRDRLDALIHVLVSEDPRFRDELQVREGRWRVLVDTGALRDDLETIKGTSYATLELLKSVSKAADLTLKGLHVDDSSNLQLTVEADKLKLVCLDPSGHEWEIEGVKVK